MIQGAIKLFKEKAFIVPRRERLQKLLALVSVLCMNIFERKKMFYTLFVTVSITMQWSVFQVMRLKQEQLMS